MAINKVIYGNDTLVDLTQDTVSADNLLSGETAHDRSGALIQGTVTVPDELNDLSDVNTSSPTNGQGLIYDTTTSEWINGDVAKPSDIPTKLSDLSDDATHRLVTDTEKNTWDSKATSSDITNAINALDGGTIGTPSTSKTVTALSETNGQISATFGDIQIAESQVTNLTTDLGKKANLASPTFTGTPKAPTAALGTDSTQIATTAFVQDAIEALPEPMVFKGSLGTGGTITALPVDGSASIGDTYKVITAGTYAGQSAKVGDTFICETKTSSANTWTLIPSGDEPSGTVTSITIKATSPIETSSSSAITTSGTRTISHATSGATAGSYGDSSAQTPNYGATFKVPYVTVNDTGHVTSISEHTVKIPASDNTDEKVKQTNDTSNANLPILLANSTTSPETAGVKKNTSVYVNPSTGNLQATQLNGVTIGSSPKFTDNDTKNTAGSTDSSSKLFLIGATSQAANPQTYSHDTAYVGTNGHLYSNSKQVVNLSDSQALTNKTYNGYTLGSACAKDVPTSGDASTTQVVMGNDTRLTDERTPASHVHGNISNDGKVTTSATIANKDRLLIVDNSASNVVTGGVQFDGSTTTECLTRAGTWQSFMNEFPVAFCDTAGGTAAKTATLTNYVYRESTACYIIIYMKNANTAKSALTMSINGSTARTVRINGSASSATNYTLPAGVYIVYINGSNNFYFRTDSKLQANITGNCDGSAAKNLLLTGGTLTGNLTISKSNTETTSVDSYIYLGNDTPSGTEGCSRGVIQIFSSSQYRTNIYHQTALTGNKALYIPNVSGTILTSAGGTIDAQDGTTSSVGVSQLTLGNNKTSTADKNSRGIVAIFSNTQYSGTIAADNLTGDRYLSLPDTDGIFAYKGEDLADFDNTNTKFITSDKQVGQTYTNNTNNHDYSILFSNTYNKQTSSENNTARKGDFFFNPYYCRIYLRGTSYAYIQSSGQQTVHLAASNESDYRMCLGVVDNTWTVCPSKDHMLQLGTANYRWGQIYSSNASIYTSDRNQKKDIEDLSENSRDFIMNLKPVSYKMKDGTSGRTHYGFIAQDVEETLEGLNMTAMDFAGFCKDQKTKPVMIKEKVLDNDGKETDEEIERESSEPIEGEYVYGLRYEEFIAPLIKTVQLQQKEIDELKKEVELLKKGSMQ